MKRHWYDIRETGCETYPEYYLTHWGDSKKYTIMVLAWNATQYKVKGWFPMAEFDTIRECRAYMAKAFQASRQ